MLGKDNNYSYTFKQQGMGSQYDLKKPNEYIQEELDKITKDNVFSVKVKDKNGNESEFKLPYTASDVKDITQGNSMYRQYELTLDWNKRVKVTENTKQFL